MKGYNRAQSGTGAYRGSELGGLIADVKLKSARKLQDSGQESTTIRQQKNRNRKQEQRQSQAKVSIKQAEEVQEQQAEDTSRSHQQGLGTSKVKEPGSGFRSTWN